MDAHSSSQQETLILVSMRSAVLFPGLVSPISVGRKASIAAAQEAARTEQPIGLVLQKDIETEEPGSADLYGVGTVASILRYVTAPNGMHHLICQGEQRFRIIEFLDNDPFLRAKIERIEEPSSETALDDKTINAYFVHLKQQAIEVVKLLPQAPNELSQAIQLANSPGGLADLVTGTMDFKPEEKQSVLETIDLDKRLMRVNDLLTYRLEVLKISHDINQRTKQSMDARQREYLLREQLKTIQSELGENDEKTSEIEELKAAVEQAKMPEEAREEAEKELRRLERMTEASAEYGMVRTYLDWLIELPWSKASEDMIDIKKARSVLDEDHYGLDRIKRRILEHLAVHKLSPESKSPILCFVGPPGVGKTSLGQSIARAMGREFVRVSLGGVHDEAEIRGHRRTYIGSLPGNIIQSMRKARTHNPVMMLDEVDKLGHGVQGDPAAALLEVLDPEQNHTFRDHYIGVPFDLSRVMFIATANVIDSIPIPLLDRMEIIELSGYTEEDKYQIAERYLVNREKNASGLNQVDCELTPEAIYAIIRDYTREAGCRSLQREIGAVFRHIAMRVAESETGPFRIDEDEVTKILGSKRFENEVAMRTTVPGVATGLAWTPVGGDILFIEATQTPGTGRLILTGQLGDVMKESAQTALTLVKTKADALNIDPKTFEVSDVHIHVPAGAIPKDGPSAGVAMFIALASLFTSTTVRKDIAMTGEISLRGLVLPVGGIKEKVIAAQRAGLNTVILPERNRKVYEDIPDSVKEKLAFVWITHVDEAVSAALDRSNTQPDQTPRSESA